MNDQTNPTPQLVPLPGLTLWEYGEQVRATWTAAEDELARALRWLVLVVAVQALTLANVADFRADSSAQTIKFFQLELKVPGYLIGLGLAVVAGYLLSQYLYAWFRVSGSVQSYRAVITRLFASADAQMPKDKASAEADDTNTERSGDSPPTREQEFTEPLIPPRSVAGRLPSMSTGGIRWLSWMDGPSEWIDRRGGAVVYAIVTLFEIFMFGVLCPRSVSLDWLPWVLGLLAVGFWIIASIPYLSAKRDTVGIDGVLERLATES